MLSFALAHWGAYNEPAAAFFLLPTRGWEIAVGAFIAFYFSRCPTLSLQQPLQELGSALGLLLIGYAVFAFSKETPFPGAYALVPTLGAALVILCATPTTLVGRLLSTRAFVGIGLISYSMYLWHQPLFAFARHVSDGEPAAAVFGSLIALSLILAFMTWKYVERPFRHEATTHRRQAFLTAGVVWLTFITLGLSGHFLNGKVENHWLSRVDPDQRGFYAQLISSSTPSNNLFSDGFQTPGNCRFNVGSLNMEVSERILYCARVHGAGVLILGDSHAMDLFGAVSSRFESKFLIGITSGGCRPHTPEKGCQYDRVMQFVRDYPSAFRHIIFEQAGFYLLLDKFGRKGTRKMFSNLGHDDPIDWVAVDQEHIRLTTTYLVKLAEFVPVTWFLPRIEPHISKNFIMKNGCEESRLHLRMLGLCLCRHRGQRSFF
jgi:hypothetical protein